MNYFKKNFLMIETTDIDKKVCIFLTIDETHVLYQGKIYSHFPPYDGIWCFFKGGNGGCNWLNIPNLKTEPENKVVKFEIVEEEGDYVVVTTTYCGLWVS